jgi:hypothetical protein
MEVSSEVGAAAMAIPATDHATAAASEFAGLERQVAAAGEPLRLPKPFGIALDTARPLG